MMAGRARELKKRIMGLSGHLVMALEGEQRQSTSSSRPRHHLVHVIILSTSSPCLLSLVIVLSAVSRLIVPDSVPPSPLSVMPLANTSSLHLPLLAFSLTPRSLHPTPSGDCVGSTGVRYLPPESGKLVLRVVDRVAVKSMFKVNH